MGPAYVSSGVFTPEGFAEALMQFGASIRPAIKRSLQRDAKIPRAIYMAKARKHGVLKAIFGKKSKGMGSLVKTKVVDKGSSFILALELRGLAAMQEAGGHTKPPRQGAIYPSSAKKALKLKIPTTGGAIFASVRHKGANIARFPVAVEALSAAAPRISAGIDKAIAEFRFHGQQIATSTAVA